MEHDERLSGRAPQSRGPSRLRMPGRGSGKGVPGGPSLCCVDSPPKLEKGARPPFLILARQPGVVHHPSISAHIGRPLKVYLKWRLDEWELRQDHVAQGHVRARLDDAQRQGERHTADLLQGDLLGAAVGNGSGDAVRRHRSLQGNHRDAEHHRNLRLHQPALHDRAEQGKVQPERPAD